MDRRQALIGAVGIVATGLGVLVLVAPAVLEMGPLAVIDRLLGVFDPVWFMFVAGMVVGGYLVIVGRSTPQSAPKSAAERRFDGAISSPPESVVADRRMVAAHTVDADVETAIELGGPHLWHVRSVLLQTAASVYADGMDVTLDRAERAIEEGTWTTDSTAAWFLAGADGPEPPVSASLRLWLTPERERTRRIEQTLSEIERLRDATGSSRTDAVEGVPDSSGFERITEYAANEHPHHQ